MRRRVYTLVSALSLVLCIATAALWIRSHSYCTRLLTSEAYGDHDHDFSNLSGAWADEGLAGFQMRRQVFAVSPSVAIARRYGAMPLDFSNQRKIDWSGLRGSFARAMKGYTRGFAYEYLERTVPAPRVPPFNPSQ